MEPTAGARHSAHLTKKKRDMSSRCSWGDGATESNLCRRLTRFDLSVIVGALWSSFSCKYSWFCREGKETRGRYSMRSRCASPTNVTASVRIERPSGLFQSLPRLHHSSCSSEQLTPVQVPVKTAPGCTVRMFLTSSQGTSTLSSL